MDENAGNLIGLQVLLWMVCFFVSVHYYGELLFILHNYYRGKKAFVDIHRFGLFLLISWGLILFYVIFILARG